MNIAIIIASVGRPIELARWPDHVAAQTVAPSQLILSVAGPSDLPDGFDTQRATVVQGNKGLPHQRNAGLAALDAGTDIVAFFDDDYVPSRYCLEGIVRAFAEFPDLVGVSGRLLADGINSPGIAYDDANRLVAAFDAQYSAGPIEFSPLVGTYGCNMAFRRAAIGTERFDERLPLYAWQEDIDFSRRLLPMGRIARCTAFTGVHQGSKSGRTSGRKLGYSQVSNPLYLIGKGTMPASAALALMARNIAINHVRMLKPEPWIDRAGRVAGNWRAVGDLVTGKLHPERILQL